jgi:hypothetical protein
MTRESRIPAAGYEVLKGNAGTAPEILDAVRAFRDVALNR